MAETKQIKKLTKKVGDQTFEVQVESAVRDGVGHKIDTYYGKASDVETLKTSKQHKLAEGNAISLTAGTDADTIAVKVDNISIEVNAAGNLQVKEVAASKITVADAAGKIEATTVEGALAELADGVANAGKVDKLKLGDVEVSPDGSKVVNIATDGIYNASTNKVATESTVKTAIDKLDFTELTVGASKTLTSIKEVDGVISADAVDIQIAESQVTNLTTDLGNKVDKEEGKSLVADTEITKLAGIEAGAQVNKIQIVKVDGAELSIADADKSVNIDLSGKVDKVSGYRLMSDDEGTKLAGIAAGAQVNVIEGVKINGKQAEISGKIVDLGNIATDDRVKEIEKTVNGYTPDGQTEKVKGLVDKVADLETGKQDKLTAQTAYTTVGNKDTVPVITTNALGQVTSITTVAIDHPTVDQVYDANSTSEKAIAHKAVAGAIKEVREVAAGKTKTFVVNYTTDNPTLNSQEAVVTVSSLTTTDKKTINPADVKIGDNVLITETEVPDRWVSAVTGGSISLSKLETTKVVLDNYVTKASPAKEGNVALLTADGSIKDAGYALVFTDTTITIDDTPTA